ncbi:PREDICTED: uncharacterized protein LOC107067348 isoform X2 [Polistes dominula]|uniref:Uncharacterized protein LOC107067348 isoform X2 n=1 Tax=Polistes dominula TaxID=743375 RepID=A0ABM1IDH5_POLDO|nr:PREDICTED: uncharacterized protein LOC107067348 isoform X2 [Polistes dominula]
MFREGQYIEVIKAWDNCVATVVVTVQERIIEIKKKKVSTNKWLDLEDWAAVYKMLDRVVLRNCKNNINEQCYKKLEGNQWKKFTRQLDITCTIESFEYTKDTLLLTIRVNVSPAKRKLTKVVDNHEQSSGDEKQYSKELSNSLVKKDKDNLDKPDSTSNSQLEQFNYSSNCQELEEYVPDALITQNSSPLKYIPSRKSTLQRMQIPCEEYTPVQTCNVTDNNVPYVPNSIIKNFTNSYEAYEPHSITSMELVEEYVPNSKGIKSSVEEYEPDFRGKLMKFDESYVPSSVQTSNDVDVKRIHKIDKLKSRRKGTLTSKKKSQLF